MKLSVKDIWSVNLDPPSEGLPPNVDSFAVFVQVAIGEDGPGSETFQFMAVSPDRVAEGGTLPTLVLKRFSWSELERRVVRILDEVGAEATNWKQVYWKLAPMMKYADIPPPEWL